MINLNDWMTLKFHRYQSEFSLIQEKVQYTRRIGNGFSNIHGFHMINLNGFGDCFKLQHEEDIWWHDQIFKLHITIVLDHPTNYANTPNYDGKHVRQYQHDNTDIVNMHSDPSTTLHSRATSVVLNTQIHTSPFNSKLKPKSTTTKK